MEYWGNYEQSNACQSYWQGNPNSNFYNENPRNEPDFSWTSNAVPNPPYHYQPTYQQPYQSAYHPPFQSTYQDPYQPHLQPTYQEPYHSPCQYSEPHMPTFRQPLPYNPPQPNNDLAELKAMLQQSINIEQQTHVTLKTQEEELNRPMLHQKNQETLFAQIANSNSMWQPENLPPQEQQSHEIVHTIMFRSSTDYDIPKISEDDEFEVPSKGLEVEIVNEVESEDETEILVESMFTRPSIISVDRLKAPASIDTNTRSSISPTDRVNIPGSNDAIKTRSSNEESARVNAPESPISENLNIKAKTKEPERKIVIQLPFPNRLRKAKVDHKFDTLEATINGEKPIRKQDDDVSKALMCLDSQVDEVDDHRAMVDALEAALYGEEPTSGQSEEVSKLEHTPEAIEVMTSELQPEAIEVNNLELKLSPSDLNINVLHDNEDCFIIKNIALSKPNPPSLIVSDVYIHETPLEKGQFFCIQDQEELKPTMPEVVKEEVRPERDGTRRGTKRCWDPGGFFDEVRIGPWAWQRDAGNRFGGANGRGTQDDYDDPGDEQVTMYFVH